MTMLDMTGRWEIEWASPLGTEHIVLELVADGERIAGRAIDEDGEYELTEGRLEGERASGAFRTTKPIPLTVTFDVLVRGETLSGKARAGILPAAPVTGHRVTRG